MHSIRLRGPWHFEVISIAAGDVASPEGKQQMPADWSRALGSDFRGVVLFSRSFHAPTGLEPDQQVQLTFSSVRSRGTVVLNGELLGPVSDGGASFDIATRLLPFNQLQVEITQDSPDDPPGGIVGEVQLEIQTVCPRPADEE